MDKEKKGMRKRNEIMTKEEFEELYQFTLSRLPDVTYLHKIMIYGATWFYGDINSEYFYDEYYLTDRVIRRLIKEGIIKKVGRARYMRVRIIT